jgi:hypothetical protein
MNLRTATPRYAAYVGDWPVEWFLTPKGALAYIVLMGGKGRVEFFPKGPPDE